MSKGRCWFAAVALAVFLGHLFPVFLRFKGGKGVATALGVLLALMSGWDCARWLPGCWWQYCSASRRWPP